MKKLDRVRGNTSTEINTEIDRQTDARVREYATKSREEITRRIEELEREWDMERLLEANAATLALSGVILSATHSRKWLILPGFVTSFLLQHAIQGWCPPVPVFRRFGVRTRKEIDTEKYALKVLRGDFDNSESAPSAEAALRAARA